MHILYLMLKECSRYASLAQFLEEALTKRMVHINKSVTQQNHVGMSNDVQVQQRAIDPHNGTNKQVATKSNGHKKLVNGKVKK